jgi:hypothetical protein
MVKRAISFTAFVLYGLTLLAQGDGSAGIAEATQMVTSYFDPAV